jgi:hypothetical protein
MPAFQQLDTASTPNTKAGEIECVWQEERRREEEKEAVKNVWQAGSELVVYSAAVPRPRLVRSEPKWARFATVLFLDFFPHAILTPGTPCS